MALDLALVLDLRGTGEGDASPINPAGGIAGTRLRGHRTLETEGLQRPGTRGYRRGVGDLERCFRSAGWVLEQPSTSYRPTYVETGSRYCS